MITRIVQSLNLRANIYGSQERIVIHIALILLIMMGLLTSACTDGGIATAKQVPSTDARSIYIGDVILLEISARGLFAEEIREKFKDFEVMEYKEDAGRYLVSLRTFEPGAYVVSLGDKEIVIDVRSTLEDIERDGVFEGGARVIPPGFSMHWRILFYMAASVFALTCLTMLSRTVLGKKPGALAPYQLFLRRSASLSVESETYFVELTRCFKEYIERLYQCRIIGKTSQEIVHALTGIRSLDPMLSDIELWLRECDRLKFTGIQVPNDIKREHYRALLSLAEKVDVPKAGTCKEGAP